MAISITWMLYWAAAVSPGIQTTSVSRSSYSVLSTSSSPSSAAPTAAKVEMAGSWKRKRPQLESAHTLSS